MPELTRHADHDPSVICRPALGNGLCEPLPQLTAFVRCQVCGTVPCDSAEEADKRAERHTKVTGHAASAVVEAVREGQER